MGPMHSARSMPVRDFVESPPDRKPIDGVPNEVNPDQGGLQKALHPRLPEQSLGGPVADSGEVVTDDANTARFLFVCVGGAIIAAPRVVPQLRGRCNPLFQCPK